MSDNKARRVSVRKKYRAGRYVDGKYHVEDDPNGTHMLVPVEVWERRTSFLKGLSLEPCENYDDDTGTCCTDQGIGEEHWCWSCAALTVAEIGGGDE